MGPGTHLRQVTGVAPFPPFAFDVTLTTVENCWCSLTRTSVGVTKGRVRQVWGIRSPWRARGA